MKTENSKKNQKAIGRAEKGNSRKTAACQDCWKCLLFSHLVHVVPVVEMAIALFISLLVQ